MMGKVPHMKGVNPDKRGVNSCVTTETQTETETETETET